MSVCCILKWNKDMFCIPTFKLYQDNKNRILGSVTSFRFYLYVLPTSKLNQKDHVIQNINPIIGKETVNFANCCKSNGTVWRVIWAFISSSDSFVVTDLDSSVWWSVNENVNIDLCTIYCSHKYTNLILYNYVSLT